MSASPTRTLRSRRAPACAPAAVIRCAIYTRVSTDERLGQEFNSLHNQRESAELHIRALAGEGWQALPEVYEDPGFSGGTLDRPGLKRLIAAVEAGDVDRVIVYKIDRLTRSLLDFGRLAEIFEKHGASIVSVTQQFDTSSSMGRLTLNMLLSFAQFEREMISERTADKMAASRRKGKWVGGVPMLGYDVAPEGGKLVVNKAEAALVRQIFDLYLEVGSLLPVVEELNRRGWTGKTWTTKGGTTRQGQPFTKNSLHKLLTNMVYAGKVNYRGREVYDGEHKAIVDEATFEQVQDLLAANRVTRAAVRRSKYKPLLSGLLHCAGCSRTMLHAPSTARGITYRYYRCRTAMQQGKDACTGGSVPAGELETMVVDQIRVIGRDPEVVLATLREAQRQLQAKLPALKAEKAALTADLARQREERDRLVKLIAAGHDATGAATEALDGLQEAIGRKDARLSEVKGDLRALKAATVDEADLRQALAAFDPIWDALFPHEKQRVLQLLVERVDYDAATGKVMLAFRPTGIRTLATEMAG